MTKETKKTIKKLVWSAVGLLALIAIIFVVMHHFGLDNLTKEELRDYIDSKGAIAPLVFIIISFLQVTFVPIPGAITILAGNIVFGMWESFLYSYIGMLLGGMFAYFLGKVIGRPFADWLAGGKEKVDEWLLKLRGRENVLLFFMFLFPFFPDDILCTVAGLMPISPFGFFLMQLVTRATSVAGTLFFMSGEFIPWHGIGLVFLIIISILFIIAFFVAFIYAENIDNWVNGLFRKVYYGEQRFLLKKKGAKAGKKRFIGKKIELDGKKWRVAAVYKTPEGYVVDIYSAGAKKSAPQTLNFTAVLDVDDEVIQPEFKFESVFHVLKKNVKETERKKEHRIIASKYMVHYKLEKNRARRFVRLCFPCNTSVVPEKFELTLKSFNNTIEVVNLTKKKKGIKDAIELVKND